MLRTPLASLVVLFACSCAAGGQGTAGGGGAGGAGSGGAAASSVTSSSAGASVSSSSASSSQAASSTSASAGSGGQGGQGGAGGDAASSSSESASSASASSASSASSAGSAASSSSSSSSSGGGTTPVDLGVYTFTGVMPGAMKGPVAAAWHPSGGYALILNSSDTIYRYDPVTHSVTQVASAGGTVSWRNIVFAPGGDKAVVLGNTTAEGRIYLWDDATSALTQDTAGTLAGYVFESIAWSHDRSTARLLARNNPSNGAYLAYLYHYDITTGRGAVKATSTSAGCQDLAFATDGFDTPVAAVTCGVNGATLLYEDGTDLITTFSGNAGNTSRISARPQGDYALAVTWSDARVTFFKQGQWTTGFNNPNLPSIFGVKFNDAGTRALFFGGAGKLYEFRHYLPQVADITNVSIPNFTMPPYNNTTQDSVNDVAWRPGCDGGLVVGGSDSVTYQHAFVARFSVDNGAACAN